MFNIMHCFTKHTIIHQFEKVLLKVIISFYSQFGIQINVLLQPGPLFHRNVFPYKILISAFRNFREVSNSRNALHSWFYFSSVELV